MKCSFIIRENFTSYESVKKKKKLKISKETNKYIRNELFIKFYRSSFIFILLDYSQKY